MKLYHGTSANNLEGFIKDGVKLTKDIEFEQPRFCTSISLKEAGFFALRKTPMIDLTQTGVVLEFDAKDMIEDEDFIRHNDKVLRDEQEVVVFTVDKLALVAYYTLTNQGWERKALDEKIGG